MCFKAKESTVFITTFKQRCKALRIVKKKWRIYLLKWGEEERQRGLLLLSHFHLDGHKICFYNMIIYIYINKQCTSILSPYAWRMILRMAVFCISRRTQPPVSTFKIMQVLHILGGAAGSPVHATYHFQWVKGRCVASTLNQQVPVNHISQ